MVLTTTQKTAISTVADSDRSDPDRTNAQVLGVDTGCIPIRIHPWEVIHHDWG